jgi:hypothetical protein
MFVNLVWNGYERWYKATMRPSPICAPVADQELVVPDADRRAFLVRVDPRQHDLRPRPAYGPVALLLQK